MSTSFELTGKLIKKYDTVQRTETFKTREFVVETSEEVNGRLFTNYAKFQCVQDRTSILDGISEGENVRVQFNIRGTKWVKEGRENYITNLDAWRIEKVLAGGNNAAPIDPIPSPAYNDMPSSDNATDDDLPF